MSTTAPIEDFVASDLLTRWSSSAGQGVPTIRATLPWFALNTHRRMATRLDWCRARTNAEKAIAAFSLLGSAMKTLLSFMN